MLYVKDWFETGMRFETYLNKKTYLISELSFNNMKFINVKIVDMQNGNISTRKFDEVFNEIKALYDFNGEILAIRETKLSELVMFDATIHDKTVKQIKTINNLRNKEELNQYLFKLNVLENLQRITFRKSGVFTLKLPNGSKKRFKQEYAVIIREDTLLDVIRIEVNKDTYLYYLEERANMFGVGIND